MSQTIVPPLKWAGSKRWFADRLYATLIQNSLLEKKLVVPFCGGMSDILSVMPERALLGDACLPLLLFWDSVHKGEILAATRRKPYLDFKTIRKDSDYYELRCALNDAMTKHRTTEGTIPPEEQADMAAMFYLLNKTCFNGLCRLNQNIRFNTPWNRKACQVPDYNWTDLTKAMLEKDWRFRFSLFHTLAFDASDSVLYVDPPYHDQFTGFTGMGFTFDDQIELCAWLTGKDCPVIAFNSATDPMINMYHEAGFEVELVCAPRSIKPTGDRTATEMIAYKGLRLADA